MALQLLERAAPLDCGDNCAIFIRMLTPTPSELAARSKRAYWRKRQRQWREANPARAREIDRLSKRRQRQRQRLRPLLLAAFGFAVPR